MLWAFGLGQHLIIVGQAEHVVAWRPAKLVVSKEVDGICATLLESHEPAAYFSFGHYLQREQSF